MACATGSQLLLKVPCEDEAVTEGGMSVTLEFCNRNTVTTCALRLWVYSCTPSAFTYMSGSSPEAVPDFAALVSAAHEAEAADDDADRTRAAYDALLRDFPLCYGYWKRYADFEVSKHEHDRANAVYERSLVLGRFCVELWAYYGAHATAHWQKPEDVRALFERGAPLVGSDYGADCFWDRYIAFETKHAGDDFGRVSNCYRRVLQLPLRALDALWLRFHQLAVERSCAEILDDKEEAKLQEELEAAGLAPHRPPSAEVEDDGARKLRLLPLLEAQFRRAKASHADRLGWESAVTRRHFHLKPLDEASLTHWHAYLDWEEARGNVPRLMLTFERCLVPCSMDYPLWERYVRSLESRGMITEARDAFARASSHFLRRRFSVLLDHAIFEEAHSNLEEARRLCAEAVGLRPPSLEAGLAQANLERRAGDVTRLRKVYESAVDLLSGDPLAYVVRHAARYAHQVLKASAWASELLESALRKEPASEDLWDLRLTHETECMEAADTANGDAAKAESSADEAASGQRGPQVAQPALQRVFAIFERALLPDSGLSDEARQAVWRRYVQCAADYSDSVAQVRELNERFIEATSPKRRRTGGAEAPAAASCSVSAACTSAAAATATAAAAAYPPYASAADYAYHHYYYQQYQQQHAAYYQQQGYYG